MKNYNIQLPFFPGFYESPLFYSDMVSETIQYYNDLEGNEKELTEDDLDIDYDGYEQECCRQFAEAFEELSPSFVKSVKYVNITSPKEYNFYTDRINAEVALSDNWRSKMLKFMEKNKEELTKKIYNDWSDRDGFWSFMSNRYDDWIDEITKDDNNIDERYIEEMLRYFMKFDNNQIDEELWMAVTDEVNLVSYVTEKESME